MALNASRAVRRCPARGIGLARTGLTGAAVGVLLLAACHPTPRAAPAGAAPLSVADEKSPAPASEPPASKPPRLVLQLTVDQLRGDLPFRYADRLTGGLKYLMEQGLWYVDAHHSHANTETIVGHATLATGAQPAAHGMVGNVWFDRTLKRPRYNVEDGDFPLLSQGAGVDKKHELDATQKVARSDGRSPVAIAVTTFTDQLVLHTGGRAKIFAVSVKDRGAIPMSGHFGKAFWFSKAIGAFVTSRYYYDAHPAWVTKLQSTPPAARYAGTAWSLLNERSTYLFGANDDAPWEQEVPGFGRVFPHPYGAATDPLFTTRLTVSPAGDEMTAAFAKALLVEEQLGLDEVPDYLSVSLSSADYVGHMFGPSSLESEDNLLRVDRLLGDFLEFVDAQVGLEHTFIVLSADHGVAEVPAQLRQRGTLDVGTLQPAKWDLAPLHAALRRRFGLSEEAGLLRGYVQPYFYLNHEVMASKRLDAMEVEHVVEIELERLTGVADVISTTALRTGKVGPTPYLEAVQNNDHLARSGDLYVVFEPGWFIDDLGTLVAAANHGSPWAYDTHVPVAFAGAGIAPGLNARRVYTVDVASTLAARLGTGLPSGATGAVLPEVVR